MKTHRIAFSLLGSALLAFASLTLPVLAAEAASGTEAEQQAARRAAERASHEAERLAARGDELRAEAKDRERAAAEAARARAALRQTQQELAEVAARVAEMSARIASEDMHRALREGALGRPLFGVVLEADASRGVLISAVSPQGPAQEAGLRPGDRLLAVAGRSLVAESGEARLSLASDLLREAAPDRETKLRIERGGSELDFAVVPRSLPQLAALRGDRASAERWAQELTRVATPMTRFQIGELSPFAPCAEGENCLAEALLASQRWNGLRLFPLNSELGRYFGSERGVLVLESGQDHPLRPGDVLLSVAGVEVDTPAAVMRQLRGGSADSRELRLRRDGREQRLQIDAVDLDPGPALRGLLPPLPAPPLPPGAPLPPPPPESAAMPGAAQGVLGRVLAR